MKAKDIFEEIDGLEKSITKYKKLVTTINNHYPDADILNFDDFHGSMIDKFYFSYKDHPYDSFTIDFERPWLIINDSILIEGQTFQITPIAFGGYSLSISHLTLTEKDIPDKIVQNHMKKFQDYLYKFVAENQIEDICWQNNIELYNSKIFIDNLPNYYESKLFQ